MRPRLVSPEHDLFVGVPRWWCAMRRSLADFLSRHDLQGGLGYDGPMLQEVAMGGWKTAGWTVRREGGSDVTHLSGRWTAPDVGITIVAFLIHWGFGLAFLGLKLWQQASGYQGSVFSFGREKWEGLVTITRNLLSGATLPAMHFGTRSSGNHAFDAWRRTELERIEAERAKLRAAEREFAAYRDELLHAKDREDFDRFMRARS